MCGKKLKIFFLLLGLFFLLPCSPFCFSCYADVVLTDEEAEEMLNEIAESKKELESVKAELNESKEKLENVQKESQEQKTELQDVKNTYNEQKTSYEMQLKEAKRDKAVAWGVAGAGTATSTILVIIVMCLIL